ncbi:ExbD/TolR family protein [Immundisolibacter cernigliae]|uniref:Biopolymer transporter ExbD n=1 Tax=Immundisolibacter cernigliae TaxID=1810504 RepID=A0A1B1YRM4_9GAMM|nr:biopolymer transporter ExbD [Immundisolibacter cernigliae]ANX03337.1 biopolymer transporter ExbD [Immundisolibacter cernigliae]
MAFGGFGDQGRQRPTAEINMIPLIDVMLVLLVIFIVTAPLLTHAVRVDLPQASSAPAPADPQAIDVSIDAQGQTFWNAEPVTEEELAARLAAAAQHQPQPELRLRADGAVAYRKVALVMAAAASAGLERIGFVTTPKRETP